MRFKDGHIQTNRQYVDVVKGQIKNIKHPSIYGVGYVGQGEYITSKNYKSYQLWVSMIQRGHSAKFHLKEPTYKDVTVCKEWHNFQNFAKWYEDNYNPKTMKGWDLDKDILSKEFKIYSAQTCCFVPTEINLIFALKYKHNDECPIGIIKTKHSYIVRVNKGDNREYVGSFKTLSEAIIVNKRVKEAYVKEVAQKWKHLISYKVYEILLNHTIENYQRKS